MIQAVSHEVSNKAVMIGVLLVGPNIKAVPGVNSYIQIFASCIFFVAKKFVHGIKFQLCTCNII